MNKIVDLQSVREKALEQRSFGPWRRRFGEAYGVASRVGDLSDRTVFYLAQPGENSASAFYELILGALDWGPAARFYYLSNDEQMRVVDIHLLLADQVRFELMRRLGWVKGFPGQGVSLLELVQQAERVKTQLREQPPELDESHPDHGAFQRLAPGDRAVFIRRLLREALEAFKKQLEE